MALTNLLQALAGLGLFLFAMSQLESAARALLAGRAAGWLQQAAGTPVKGVLLGVAVTALMQSSSLVGLLVLALVTVRVLALRHALAIMLGANLGTTMTGWLVTVLGFKLSLGEAGLPLAGLGGLLAIALPEGQRSLGRFVFALGLLLLGLDTMKTAVEVVGTRFDLAVLQGLPPIVYLLVGVGLTALIQSSSASMLISLAALNGGLVSLPEALAFDRRGPGHHQYLVVGLGERRRRQAPGGGLPSAVQRRHGSAGVSCASAALAPPAGGLGLE